MSLEHDLAQRLPRLAARWRAGELDDAAYAAAYFLIWRIAVDGRRFASRNAKSDPRPEAAEWLVALDAQAGEALRARLVGWFERYHFLGVIPAVPAAFLGWLRESWPLRLSLAIPSPAAVLAMQAEGWRPVTVIADPARALRPVLTKADGCAFLVHDLEHAYKFCHDPLMHAAQRRFFGRVLDAVEAGLFASYQGDAKFAEQFDYLASDMNTHPVHSLRYLVAVLIECLLRREGKGMREPLSGGSERELMGLIERLGALWRFPEDATAALLNLFRGEFSAAGAALMERAILAGPDRGGAA